ncbi:MAG TPA: hypothetical protein VLW50_04515 [Streptosporangiaceae bacterium]|nr:hypothetical protein [Streptosporangiaceae bacterium]
MTSNSNDFAKAAADRAARGAWYQERLAPAPAEPAEEQPAPLTAGQIDSLSAEAYAEHRQALGVKDPDAGLFGEVKFTPRPSTYRYGAIERYRQA